MAPYEYDADGNLKILKSFKKKQELHKSTRNLLLLSNKIIEVKRIIRNEVTPKTCDIEIKIPENINMKVIANLFYKAKEFYKPMSKNKYGIDGNIFTLSITSGSKRCSFCKGFIEWLDKNLSQEIILIDDLCLEWNPKITDKLQENEYMGILNEIVRKRLEYFANTTSKYRDKVLKRDGYRCLSCKTDGKTPFIRKNGKPMANPLQIHHMRYDEDSPDSLITLCSVCHFKLHRRLYVRTGKWSSKTKEMKLDKNGNK